MQKTTLSAKTLVFLMIAVIVLATGAKVFASNENSDKGKEARETHAVQFQDTNNDSDDDNETLSVTGTLAEDECGVDFKNHGAYVSCIAKLHLGGTRVSTAAKSDIGKKDHDNDDSVSPTITPSESSTETPSVTVTPEVTATVTLQAQIQQLIDLIKHLLDAIHF